MPLKNIYKYLPFIQYTVNLVHNSGRSCKHRKMVSSDYQA